MTEIKGAEFTSVNELVIRPVGKNCLIGRYPSGSTTEALGEWVWGKRAELEIMEISKKG